MIDANVKAETNAAPLNETANGTAKLKFDMPFFNIQTMFGALAGPTAARAKANFEQMKATSRRLPQLSTKLVRSMPSVPPITAPRSSKYPIPTPAPRWISSPNSRMRGRLRTS